MWKELVRLESVVVALFFAALVTIGHVYFLDVSADPRMVLQPWLLRNGFLQYEHIADEHAPLLPQVLAWLLPLFQDDALVTMRVAHGFFIGSAVVVAALWAYQVSGRWGALATSAFFWNWSTPFGYWGMWHNLALSPVYLLFFITLVSSWRRLIWKMVVLGLITGLAMLLKQHAVLLLLIGLAWLVWQAYRSRISRRSLFAMALIYLLSASALVAAYVAYYLVRGGSVAALVYWPLIFNVESGYHIAGRLLASTTDIYHMLPAFIMLVPFLISIVRPQADMTPPRAARFWLFTCLLASIVFLYPRYSIPHWAVALPFAALLSGIACADLVKDARLRIARNSTQWGLYMAIVILWLIQGALLYWPYWNGTRTQTLIKYGHLVELAHSLETRIPADGGLVLVPDNEAISNLYYLLQRRPPYFWVMNYPWFMSETTIERWIEVVEQERPQTLLYFVDLATLASDAPDILEYVEQNYETVETLTWENRLVHVMIRRGQTG